MNMKKTYSGEYRTTESCVSTDNRCDICSQKIAVNLETTLCKSESKLEKFICVVIFFSILNNRFTYTTCIQLIKIHCRLTSKNVSYDFINNFKIGIVG